MTKQQEDLQIIALDFIAAMTYQTKLNIDCLDKESDESKAIIIEGYGFVFRTKSERLA